MKRKTKHRRLSYNAEDVRKQDLSQDSRYRLRNRILAISVFSLLVFGVLLNLNPGGSGNVVSITSSGRVKLDSYAAPSTAFTGENVVVNVFVSKPANSFAYGYLECSVKNWRGKSLETTKIVTYEPRCIKLPESSSFTLQYSFKPLVKGYYKVQYCKITTSPSNECSGAKFTELKRQTTGLTVYN